MVPLLCPITPRRAIPSANESGFPPSRLRSRYFCYNLVLIHAFPVFTDVLLEVSVQAGRGFRRSEPVGQTELFPQEAIET